MNSNYFGAWLVNTCNNVRPNIEYLQMLTLPFRCYDSNEKIVINIKLLRILTGKNTVK